MPKLIFLPLVALTLGAGSGPPSQDKVEGSARFAVVDAHVVVTAHSGPAGQDPHGMFKLDQAGGTIDFTADVTCLYVVGNRAAIGAVITKSKTGLLPVGQGVLQIVVDNGESGADPPDMSQTFLIPEPLTVCPDPNLIPVGFSVDQGNYVVHDAA